MTLYGPDGSVLDSKSSIRADRQHEREEEVRVKLKQIDELLDIQYVDWAGRYALIVKWPQSDERWKMFQSGEISSPYDNLGWFCEDMQDPKSLPVGVDSIENKVLERLASCDNTKTPWKARMRSIAEKNMKARKARQEEIVGRTEEIANVLYQAVGRHHNHKVERIIKEIEGGAV